jgi:DNA-binding PadR family transcriptional regulator
LSDISLWRPILKHPFHSHFGHPHFRERFMRRGRDDASTERRRHGGGGPLGRFFAHGDLRLVILNLIAEKPRHGYEIIKLIEDAAGGAYTPSPGVIYPTLTLLEEMGYAAAEADGAKKLYSITTEGRAFIKANRGLLEALIARMAHAGGRHAGRPAAILDAMHALKHALRARAAKGLTDDQIEAIAAAIEATAKKVEKL